MAAPRRRHGRLPVPSRIALRRGLCHRECGAAGSRRGRRNSASAASHPPPPPPARHPPHRCACRATAPAASGSRPRHARRGNSAGARSSQVAWCRWTMRWPRTRQASASPTLPTQCRMRAPSCTSAAGSGSSRQCTPAAALCPSSGGHAQRAEAGFPSPPPTAQGSRSAPDGDDRAASSQIPAATACPCARTGGTGHGVNGAGGADRMPPARHEFRLSSRSSSSLGIRPGIRHPLRTPECAQSGAGAAQRLRRARACRSRPAIGGGSGRAEAAGARITRPLRPSSSSGRSRCPAGRSACPSAGGPSRAAWTARSARWPGRCCRARRRWS